MSPKSPSRIALSSLAALLLLAGCTPTSSASNGTGDDTGTAPDDSGALTCASYESQTDPELELFTTSAITAGPSEGQTYGDGTKLSVTLSDEAIAAGYLPQFELISLSETGGPVLVSSLIFDPTTGGDGTYSTETLEFGNDELVGSAVVAEVFAIDDTPVGDTRQYGDKVLLGNYCITYANDGS